MRSASTVDICYNVYNLLPVPSRSCFCLGLLQVPWIQGFHWPGKSGIKVVGEMCGIFLMIWE